MAPKDHAMAYRNCYFQYNADLGIGINKSVFRYYVRWQRGTTRIRPPRCCAPCSNRSISRATAANFADGRPRDAWTPCRICHAPITVALCRFTYSQHIAAHRLCCGDEDVNGCRLSHRLLHGELHWNISSSSSRLCARLAVDEWTVCSQTTSGKLLD